jgi:hypothetical protein
MTQHEPGTPTAEEIEMWRRLVDETWRRLADEATEGLWEAWTGKEAGGGEYVKRKQAEAAIERARRPPPGAPMSGIPLVDHIRLDLCCQPRPTRRYSTRLWICPACGRAWVTTITPDPRLAPDGLSWRWIHWAPPTSNQEHR